MLIALSSAILNELDTLIQETQFRECVDNLAFAHRKGFHYLSGSALLMRALAQTITGDAAATLRQIANKSYEHAALLNATLHMAIVEPRPTGGVVRQRSAKQLQYHVPYSWFARPAASQASRLVVEDSDDSLIYKRVLEAFHTQHASRRALSLNVQGFGGGGSSTADQLRDHAQLGPTISIVDTDRHWADAPLGATAAAVLREAALLDTEAICDADCLPAHELENLLPARLLTDCLVQEDGEDIRRRWLAAEQRAPHSAMPELVYLDLKRGLCGWDIATASGAKQEYWSRAVTTLGRTTDCRASRECDARELCECEYVAALGPNVVPRVAEKLSRLSSHKVAEYFFSTECATADIWRALADRLFSFCCAAPRQYC